MQLRETMRKKYSRHYLDDDESATSEDNSESTEDEPVGEDTTDSDRRRNLTKPSGQSTR